MNYSEIHTACHESGMEAGSNVQISPVRIGHAKSLFSDEIDYSRPTHIMEDGPCGFAWVTIFPGNSSLAREYKRLNIAKKAHGGGVRIWVEEFGQSHDRKEAYANAYAKKLRELTGHDRIYAESMLD